VLAKRDRLTLQFAGEAAARECLRCGLDRAIPSVSPEVLSTHAPAISI
jgi:hypothetical protein